MREEVFEADVLCVGGGIAGLMAAISASEQGAKVIVAEKGNTLRSGAAAVGTDHFSCYIPEVHGPDVENVIKELSIAGRVKNPALTRTWLEKSFDILKLWDSWGIPMKYEGKYEFAGHAFPERPCRVYLKYSGQMQKSVLTKEALKRGVKIMNRVMVIELLHHEGMIGAMGVDTREDKLMLFQSRSIVLGTGHVMRLYPGLTPGWMFNMTNPGTVTGDGRAMAYRVGADLVNLEMPYRHVGPKYFSRCGQASWVGVLRDPADRPAGPFVNKPDKRCGDILIEMNRGLFSEYARSGRGPLSMDCRGISESDYEYMLYWLKHEGNVSLLNYLEEEGIDLRKNPVEFMTYGMSPAGGVFFNQKAETTVKGLYAAGDESFPEISPSATFGWIAGANAAGHARDARPPSIERKRANIEEKKNALEEVTRRKTGPGWKEVNIALQQIMNDYAGAVRSSTLLEAGLMHLRRLKEKANGTMGADNPHELMRSLEVSNLLDLGELVFVTAMAREETRGMHNRVDHPITNPLKNNQLLAVRKRDGNPFTEWKMVTS